MNNSKLWFMLLYLHISLLAHCIFMFLDLTVSVSFDYEYKCTCAESLSHVRLFCDPTDYSLIGSSIHGFSQQEYWSGLSLPPSRYLPDPGIKPTTPVSPALAGEFFTSEPFGKGHKYKYSII